LVAVHLHQKEKVLDLKRHYLLVVMDNVPKLDVCCFQIENLRQKLGDGNLQGENALIDWLVHDWALVEELAALLVVAFAIFILRYGGIVAEVNLPNVVMYGHGSIKDVQIRAMG
jgi:hypothetical protein